MKGKPSIRPRSNGFKPAGRWMCVLLFTVLFSVTNLSFAEESTPGSEIAAAQIVSEGPVAGEEGGEGL
jgi:hypothetical protein